MSPNAQTALRTRQQIAVELGFSPAHPESWPDAIIHRLQDIEARDRSLYREAIHRVLMNVMQPPTAQRSSSTVCEYKNADDAFAEVMSRDLELEMSCSSQRLTGGGLEGLFMSSDEIQIANTHYDHVQRQRADLWTDFFIKFPSFKPQSAPAAS